MDDRAQAALDRVWAAFDGDYDYVEALRVLTERDIRALMAEA